MSIIELTFQKYFSNASFRAAKISDIYLPDRLSRRSLIDAIDAFIDRTTDPVIPHDPDGSRNFVNVHRLFRDLRG